MLVCVSEHPNSLAVVRYARRMADRLRAMDRDPRRNLALGALSEAERDRIAEGLRLAQRLGGEAVTLPGQDVAGGSSNTRTPTTSRRS